MWQIRNELDFLIVKNALLGVRNAIIGQIIVLFVFAYFLSPYIPKLYMVGWLGMHLFAYAVRYGLNFFYQQLSLSKENFKIATFLFRLYIATLALTSVLWGSSILFFGYIPQNYHFLLYMIAFGFTFASAMSIGPIRSMYFAYTVPMDFAVIFYVIEKEDPAYLIVILFILMAFVYSLYASKIYYSVYHSLIKERLNAEKALQKIKYEKQKQEQQLKAIEEIGLGIIIVDSTDKIIETNASVRQWFGHVEYLLYEEFVARNILTQEHYGSHLNILTKNGKSFEMSIKTIGDLHKNGGRLILLKDITEEVKNKKIIQKMAERYKERAETDSLTKILNRESFITQLQHLVYEADRSFSKTALLFIDLDNFKSINDTYGHKAGDTVLKIVAKRIRNSLRQSDLLGRYAGDEFIVALRKIGSKEMAENIVTKLLYALSQPISIEKHPTRQTELYVTVSIGISIYPDDTKDMDQLISKADRAMYTIKAKNKNGYEFYSERTS